VSKVTEKIKTRSKPTPSENFNSHPLYRMIKKSWDEGCHGINKLSMKLFISIIFDIYLTTFKLAGYNSKCFNVAFLLLNHTTVMEIVVKMVIGFIRLVYV
jgi:hypothetical protein